MRGHTVLVARIFGAQSQIYVHIGVSSALSPRVGRTDAPQRIYSPSQPLEVFPYCKDLEQTRF